MSTYNGAILPDVILTDTSVSVNIAEFGTPFAYADIVGIAPTPFAGMVSGDGVIEPITATYDGRLLPSARDYFYDRIWVIPQRTNFGNLTSDQVIEIEVWNAYDAIKTLTNITSSGQTDGTNLTGLASGDFGPYESAIYTLHVSTFGSPTFDGRYIWHFPDDESPFAQFIGKRVIPFLFKHNWVSEVIERVGYLTRALRSFTGIEQRYGLRKYPRRTLEYSHLVVDGQRQRFDNLLIGWQQRLFALPIWTDKQTLSATLDAGSDSLIVDTQFRDFEIGGLVLFYQSDLSHELVEIEDMTETEIIFKTATLNAWVAGTKIMPVRLAELAAKSNWSRLRGSMSQMRAVWQLQAGQKVLNRLSDNSFETYRSVEVFTPRHNWADELTVDQNSGGLSLDNEFGVTQLLIQEVAPYQTFDVSLLIEGRESIADFWAFYARRSGSRVGVWVEQTSPDFTLVQDVSSAGVTMRVSAANYTQLAFPLAHRRDITIWVGGNKYRRRITGSATDVSDTEVLTIDSALGVELDVAAKPIISYLRYVRLDSDEIEVAWITDDKLQVKVRMQELLKVPD